MDISLLSTTTDIEQLRAMAFAMVQKVVTEKNAELTAKDQRIRQLLPSLRTCTSAFPSNRDATAFQVSSS